MLNIYTANAGGLGAPSKIKTVTTLVPPPTGATLSIIGSNAVRIDWQSVDKVLLYGVFVYKNDNLSSTPEILKTPDTFVVINRLMPCTNYLFGLRSANNFLIFGEESYVTYRTGSVDPVSAIQANYSCIDGFATVTWNPSSGATSYRASATTQNGTAALSCTTKTTGCQIMGLKCGAKYTVHVFALAGSCESTAEATAVFQTVPCAPINLDIYRDCYSNVVFFYWDPTPNTDFYSATALGSDGAVMECRTTDTSCFFTDLNCGMGYMFRVSSMKGKCSSAYSAPVRARTAPCEPNNMKTVVDCQSDVLISSWDTAAGALSYTVEAAGNTGKRYNCSSFSNSCAMPGIRCGESLSVWIIASDDECASAKALGEVVETVPCTPTNVTANAGCRTDSLSVSWSYSSGALMYFATVEGSDGTQHACVARDTHCQITALECGQSYTVYVTATNLKCNSSQSSRVTVQTAPCAPVVTEVFLECSASLVLVMWNQSPGAESYTATLQSNDGSNLTCNTTFTSCMIPDLKCGVHYMVTVKSHDGTCTSPESESIQMTSVPCIPENIKTHTDCETGIVKVLWDPSAGAEMHSAIVEADDGIWKYCNSTDTSCDIGGLQCGQSYTVLVMSSNGTCHSQPSQREIVQEVPCIPQHVAAQFSCNDSSAAVTWGRCKGAKYYTATVLGENGQSTQCNSTETMCNTPDLQCGHKYTVTVTASGDTCTSKQSSVYNIQTAPCPPLNVEGRIDCLTNIASISWDPSRYAKAYTATAVGNDGHRASCNVTDTNCNMMDLQCGQRYTFTVITWDGNCISEQSQAYEQETAPCVPQHVESHLDCNTNIAVVYWDQSTGSDSYISTVWETNEAAQTCNTTDTNCNVINLQCGRQYTITVRGVSETCSSPDSIASILETAPCAPSNVNGDLDCETNTVHVSWKRSSRATSYTATVTGRNHFTESCSTGNLTCSVGSLQCAEQYTITVLAENGDCSSPQSSSASVKTAPCDPQNIVARLDCITSIAIVYWDPSPGAESYTVMADGSNDHVVSCNTPDTTCQLNELGCGQLYNVTVLAQDSKCSSTPINSASIQTAPCAPTITKGRVDCESNTASVLWVQRNTAVSYTLTARGANGHQLSCSGTNTTCNLNGMQCGQTYTAYATAQGGQCESAMSTGYNIDAVPCAPTHVEAHLDCGAHTASVSWAHSKGAVSYTATAKASSGRPFSCNSTGTTCNITSLLCGQKYTVTVTGLDNNCNSVRSNATEIETAPCPPQNVNANLDCASNNASVSWRASQGAMSYRVTAVREDGKTEAACSTQSNNCDVSNLQCGLKYDITVTPLGQKCTGFQSAAFQLASRPCPPANVSTTLDCRTNIGSVSWKHELGAELFIATATEKDGHTHTCNTSHSTCHFTDLHCGNTYTVTVVAVLGDCNSSGSIGHEIKTAPCTPKNVVGYLFCDANIISVTWDQSKGAKSYILTEGQDGHTSNYTTFDTSYHITRLPCGRDYTFRITALDEVCSSHMSATLSQETVPCPPQKIEAQVDCGSNLGTVTWEQGEEALSYTAIAKGHHGHSTSCSTNQTSCGVKLDCGLMYTITVVSAGKTCNSSIDSSLQIESAPCLPQNVDAKLDCDANILSVNWNKSVGAESYTAMAIGSNGFTPSCNTTNTACTITNLECGQTYSIAVTSSTVNCSIFKGSDYKIQSAPCTPENPIVNLNCATNIASVSWDQSRAAQLYSVKALAGNGETASCNTSDTTCHLTGLNCGQKYTVNVLGMTGTCKSLTSSDLDLYTAPCAPRNVEARIDCGSSIAVVSWDQAEGATSYTATAEGYQGHQVSCTTRDTTCSMMEMQCGQKYSIIVVASDDNCNSQESIPIRVNTGPCNPTNLRASLDCDTNTVSVSWNGANGTQAYIATAESFAIGHVASCNTTDTTCDISALVCGLIYTVKVLGLGSRCNSSQGSWIRINTAPCKPPQVEVHSECASDKAAVSWERSDGADLYMAVAEWENREMLSCHTSATACEISSLQCGREYNVSVTALHGDCIGGQSTVYTIQTAPCVPYYVEAHLECENDTASIAWESSEGATSYTAIAQSSDGHIHPCNTSDTSCTLPSLKCGHTYNITVTAFDGTCNSSPSISLEMKTAPCPPAEVITRLDCVTNIASISWNRSNQAEAYLAKAEENGGHLSFCNSSETSCNITDLQCGKEYTVTVKAANNDCSGAESSEYKMQTAPCVPPLAEVQVDCLGDIAWVTWGQADGAERYIATAEDTFGDKFQCQSNDTSCEISGLKCGQQYTFTVKALDERCYSGHSATLKSETAPCTPQDVNSVLHCSNNIVVVSWGHSDGAVNYTATVEGADGNTTCCTTSETTCEISDLQCGEIYVVTVISEGLSCNSTQSAESVFKTVPCTPQNIDASLDCGSNIAIVRWDSSNGAQSYAVQATGEDGHTTACGSSDTSCNLLDLHCGQTYSFSVTAQDIMCTSKTSPVAEIITVPCTPESIETELDCGTNVVSVSWNQSAGAKSYMVTAEGSHGHKVLCNTTDTQCDLTGLNCGQNYHMTLAASDYVCTSPQSSVIETKTVPCMPEDIEAFVDCFSGTATVSWYFSTGADSYIATAHASNGHMASCNTSHTNCIISDLLCGQLYYINVLALDQTCNSSGILTNYLKTEPCIPDHVQAEYSTSVALVSWDPSDGADSYTVTAQSSQGELSSCNTTGTSCTVTDLHCGLDYNISITSCNDVCNDTAISAVIELETEPCVPQFVTTSIDCETGIVSVSWEESSSAESYLVTVDEGNAPRNACLTIDTTCEISDLLCGHEYTASVTAFNDESKSLHSASVLMSTAPCIPDYIDAVMDCDNNTAWVSWELSDGAESYIVHAEGTDGHVTLCNTTDTACNLTALHCGQVYNLSLAVLSEQCHIIHSTAVSITTMPCAPDHVNAELDCDSDSVLVSWKQSEGIDAYIATATTHTGYNAECNSTGLACNINGLQCGQSYYIRVTALNDGCSSETSSSVEVQTAPCRPESLEAHVACDSEIVSVVWEESSGASSYIVTAVGGLGHVTDFNTNDTAFIFLDLYCGQTYNITVVAQDERCNSLASTTVEIQTVPCIPQDVAANPGCEVSSGLVTWTESDGAVSYTAVARGIDGHIHVCNTTNTACDWTDLHCGEVYTVYVIAEDENCNSSVSNTTTIYTAPCIPQNLVSNIHCFYNTTSVTWDGSKGAELYLVTAEGRDGHTAQCNTNDTHCDFDQLHCGHVYTITAFALSSGCRSPMSTPIEIKTGPCIPGAVTALPRCLPDSVEVFWRASDGAQLYTATAETADGVRQSCSSAQSSCLISDLQCGELYFVQVIASDDQCNSTESFYITHQTAPCTPQNVTVELDCEENGALVSWDHSDGAVSYTVRADSSSSTLSSCSAHDTQCYLTDLTCGLQYTVHVVAINDSCSSQPSAPTNIQAAPCTPQITGACLDCFTNTVLMQWTYSEGATKYIATAESKDKDTALCNSTHTSCEILDLECGQLYSVTVVALNDRCNSSQSISQDIESVPCVPQSVDAELDCTSNTALVLWEPSSGAESYIVNAVSTDGHIASCNTSETICQVTDLMCGNTYNISVTAINQQCNVSHSTQAEIQSVPCIPQYVDAHVDCETGIVSVSWEDSQGAVSYTATAQGSGGYSSSCNTTDTTCELSDLLCGHGYSLSVTAADDTCTSIESSSRSFNTVPCVPQHVSAQLECANNTASVSWEPSEGADYYGVMAIGVDGHITLCNTSLTSCELEDLHCGQMYNFTVTVLDGECDSIQTSSDLQAAPCPPKNVRTSLQCDSNTVSVSWEQSAGAVSYSVIGQASDGHIASCNSTETFCDLAELHCGQTYSVSVIALDDTCNSIQSMSAEFKTGPCPPQHLGINMHCDSGIMSVSWDAVPSANSYTAQAAASDGNVVSCDTGDTNCFMTGLLCGMTYTVTVTSFNGECLSTPSEAFAISSAPCTPQNLNGYLDCVTNAAWVEWDPSKGAERYTVTAVSLTGLQSSCTTANTTCHVPDLQCGVKYSLTVTAFNKDCTSLESNTIYIETAPCTLQNLTAETQCNSNILKVMWDHTESTRVYIVTAEGSDGNMHSCNSSEASCDLTNVHCGVTYTIIVASSSDKCSSQRSPPYKIQTAPCAPQEITVSPDCDSHAVTVHWSPSFGTESYLLTATGSNGSKELCNSSHPNCTLQDLQCGQLYTVSVTAGAETCRSHASKEITFSTVPCVPDHLTVQMQCATNSALLSWDQSNRTLEYFASAIASDGEKLSCSSQEPGCTIDGLTCGTIYNFTVTASNGVCNSSFGVPVIAGAVPCPPGSVALSLLLLVDAVQEAKVGWSAVQCVGVEYSVEMHGLIEDDPHAQFLLTSYWTTATYFFIPVPCSSTYNVTVTSRNSAGIGYPSPPVQGLAVPCPPRGVTFYTEGTLWVISWNASVHATEYVVYSSKAQRTELCRTSHFSCTVPKKQNDTIEVTAVNSAGESEPSMEILVQDTHLKRKRRDLTEDEGDLLAPEVHVVNVTGDTLHVEWTPVEGATYYVLIIKVTEAKPFKPLVQSVQGSSAKVTGLLPLTQYSIRVSAKDYSRSSQYSDPVLFTTDYTSPFPTLAQL
ncbi:hypothetical protein HHUSO_G12572 [Huso huso]|uniref:Fibronectin type-III domain-containing protein n=1 Tax=Huso huso TaxID=61971 RepID=A0ABR0ZJV2_HUSHU